MYYETEKDDKGSDVDKRKVENNGKVVQVSANNNFSILVMERPANKEEKAEYIKSKESKRGGVKKMTDYTVIRELFCCGSGKGGVMQNQVC